jgi:hypothetical protein
VEPIAPEGAAVADAPPDTSAEVQDDTPPAGMDELADLAERAKAARLAPADEERMCALLKDALLGGKAGAIRAAEFLPRVPWIVGVRAVESVWAEMKVTARTHVLKSLGNIHLGLWGKARKAGFRNWPSLPVPAGLTCVVA